MSIDPFPIGTRVRMKHCNLVGLVTPDTEPTMLPTNLHRVVITEDSQVFVTHIDNLEGIDE